MALLDFFKKGKKTTREERYREQKKQQAKKQQEKTAIDEKPEEKKQKAELHMSERAPKVLVHPIITEKSTDLASRGSYVFRVKKNAGKTEIKKAVEELYHVDVTRVNVINIPAKERFLRGVYGKKKGYKKAIVTIREGQEISFV